MLDDGIAVFCPEQDINNELTGSPSYQLELYNTKFEKLMSYISIDQSCNLMILSELDSANVRKKRVS